MGYISRVLVCILLINTNVMAQSNTTNENVQLKLQVANLAKLVEQLRANQIVIAKKIGLVEQEKLLPGEAVRLEGAYLEGNRKAKVVIMEFTDLQCPYCQKFSLEVFPELKSTYIDSGKLLFAHRQNPISHHKQARIAAKYLLCAEAQGKFSEVKNGLFKWGGLVASEKFSEIELIANLDQSILENCLEKDALLDRKINADLQLSKRLGVSSTPSFFIGVQNDQGFLVDWVKIEGVKPFEYYSDIIDKIIAL